METKCFEVRDRGTFIPVFAMKMTPDNEAQRFLLRRSGYGDGDALIVVGSMHGGPSSYDPYSWDRGARTMHVAHQYITDNFDALSDGDVVCVEHILGERAEPKKSERLTAGAF